MTENHEVSSLEKMLPHLRGEKGRYLKDEALGVRDVDIVKSQETQSTEEPLVSHLKKLAQFLSSVVHR